MPPKSKPKNVSGKPLNKTLNNAIQTKDTPHTQDFQDLLDKILKPVLGEDLTEEKIKYLKGKCRKSVITYLFSNSYSKYLR